MARAHRHFIPGYVWHITHRCHKREILLKFSKDRDLWIAKLFEAKKRFRLSILNYIVTSNHIHLTISDRKGDNTIPRAMQFIAGGTAQSFNRRKGRKGAFWEDRYHATAIQTGEHLWRCMVCVDLNMVRARAVNHPSKWKWGGYHEIQEPKARYRLLDHEELRRLLEQDTNEALAKTHRRCVESQLIQNQGREDHWSRSIAVGSKIFVEGVHVTLGYKALGRKTHKTSDNVYHLREAISKYGFSDSTRS